MVADITSSSTAPDPALLAAFYAELRGLPVTYRSDDWVVIGEDETTSGFAFQLALDHQPPRGPDPAFPQQAHLDVMVDDLDVAELEVLALGARRLPQGDHVYADPAGHPFCLIRRPGWLLRYGLLVRRPPTRLACCSLQRAGHSVPPVQAVRARVAYGHDESASGAGDVDDLTSVG